MMNFFVPCTDSLEEAESVCVAVRSNLEALGLPTEPTRIWRLAYREEGEDRRADVGDTLEETGERILLILHAADRPLWYVCTPKRGVVDNAPFMIPDGPDCGTVDFEPPPAGYGDGPADFEERAIERLWGRYLKRP
jgi:hypothetical protein